MQDNEFVPCSLDSKKISEASAQNDLTKIRSCILMICAWSGRHPFFDLGTGAQVRKRGGDGSNSKGSGNADGVQASRHGLLHAARQGAH